MKSEAATRNFAIGCLARVKGGFFELLHRPAFSNLLTPQQSEDLYKAYEIIDKVLGELAVKYFKTKGKTHD